MSFPATRATAALACAAALAGAAACSATAGSPSAASSSAASSSAASSSAGSPSAGPASATDARIQRVLDTWAARNPTLARTGGVAVAMIPAGGSPVVAAAGTAGAGRPNLTGTEWFRLGSVTKTYVAAALLRLSAAGRVDLDRPVSRYVAGVPRIGRTTVRQLLDQTAGLPDYTATPRWRQEIEAAPNRAWTEREVLALVPPTPPTGRYAYSNTHYLLAGMVLAAVTGRPWTAAVRSTVLAPLGLAGTDTTGAGHPVVDGQIAVDDTTVTAVSELGSYRALETTAAAAGAMTATPTDLARFGTALLAGTAVPAEQWRQMRAFGPSGYGLGLADLKAAGLPLTGLGNLGEIPGYAALLVADPATGRSLALVANDDRIRLDTLAAEVQRALA